MNMPRLDERDRRLLDSVQDEIGVVHRPFRDVAARLGWNEDEVIVRLQRLMTEGVVSYVGPLYDTRAVGYRSTLVAMEVAATELDSAARVLAGYPGVSHCYERDDDLNLWSTVAVPPGTSLAEVVRILFRRAACRRVIMLPERRRYKLRVHFPLSTATTTVRPANSFRTTTSGFDDDDISVLQRLQGGIPIVQEPFVELVGSCRSEAEALRSALERHLARGFVRRVAALVRHRRVGFRANAMAVWASTDEAADAAAQVVSRHVHVSHCYLRRRAPEWPFGFYAMVHGGTEGEVRDLVSELTRAARLPPARLLFSRREFVKRRLQLFTPDYRVWLDEGSTT